MRNISWIVIFAALAAICLAVIFFVMPSRGNTAEITRDGETLYKIDLSRETSPRDIRIESADGGYNIIHIEDGTICVSEADCPDKVCVNQGKSSSGTPIVCLPHKLVIKFGNSDTDAVTGR